MQALSAFDAIAPAVHRTREFLFRNFRWGTFLKLGLVAIITEGFSRSSSHSSHHEGPAPDHSATAGLLHSFSPGSVVVIAAAVLLVIVIALFLFYLVTRLRFAYFHCLTTSNRMIRPGWHLYHDQSVRFFWFSVVVGICYFCVAALLLLPFAAGVFHAVQSSGDHPDFFQVAAFALPMIPIVLLLILAAIVSDVVMRDWMMPHFALENATAGQAWTQVWARIRADQRQFLVFTVLRVILPIIAYICLAILLLIPGFFAAGATAMFGIGVHGALAGATGSASVTAIALEIFFGVLAFGIVLVASICLAGPVCTAIREYALLFYGGRYAALGKLLDMPSPFATPFGASQQG